MVLFYWQLFTTYIFMHKISKNIESKIEHSFILSKCIIINIWYWNYSDSCVQESVNNIQKCLKLLSGMFNKLFWDDFVLEVSVVRITFIVLRPKKQYNCFRISCHIFGLKVTMRQTRAEILLLMGLKLFDEFLPINFVHYSSRKFKFN